MGELVEFFNRFMAQLQAPALAFLLAGMLLSVVNSKFRVPEAIYLFCVFMLLMKIGLKSGMAIREGNITEILLPALFCIILGVSIVLLGSITLTRLPGVKKEDALATVGLFGSVSSATLIVGMLALERESIFFEDWFPALYLFMDIPALLTAIILANLYYNKNKQKSVVHAPVKIRLIIQDCLRGQVLTVLIIGVILGLFTRPEKIYEQFFSYLFEGFFVVLMLTSGMQAYTRLKELKKAAHWYVVYAFAGSLMHGLMGFGLGWMAHLLVGFSPGGVIMMAVIAASSSDISGPPMFRNRIPTANPAIYQGTSTGLGTVLVIAIYIPFFIALGKVVFDF